MHGRQRAEYKARLSDPKVSAGLAQKAQQWNALSRELLARRETSLANAAEGHHDDSSQTPNETLKLTEKLLLVNPDPSHLWNHRRELLDLQSTFQIKDELELTAACLRRNPKAYGAWFHRKWSLRRFLERSAANSKEERRRVLETELGLCASFLELDQRNFHCWNYRRFVVAATAVSVLMEQDSSAASRLDGSWSWATGQEEDFTGEVVVQMGAQLTIPTTSDPNTKSPTLSPADIENLLQAEWDFSGKKIEQNFSNFSAFHYRSKLLPFFGKANSRLVLARQELELVQNAIFTEPDDQTAWWYHRFILAWASEDGEGNNDEYKELLREESDSIRELIETEGGRCKWGLLALHMILTRLIRYSNDSLELQKEANSCLMRLSELDPDRAKRYESMRVI